MRIIQKASVSCGLFFLLISLTGWTNAQRCPSEEDITCDNGECVPRKSWCNSTKDCADGSDESYCKRGGWYRLDPNKCEKTGKHFLCEDRRCIPLMARCDGFKDCEDGSDEECDIPFDQQPQNQNSNSSQFQQPLHPHNVPVQPLPTENRTANNIHPRENQLDINSYPYNQKVHSNRRPDEPDISKSILTPRTYTDHYKASAGMHEIDLLKKNFLIYLGVKLLKSNESLLENLEFGSVHDKSEPEEEISTTTTTKSVILEMIMDVLSVAFRTSFKPESPQKRMKELSGLEDRRLPTFPLPKPKTESEIDRDFLLSLLPYFKRMDNKKKSSTKVHLLSYLDSIVYK